MYPPIPDRVSNAGPEPMESGYTWRDYCDFADELIARACKTEWNLKTGNADRVQRIDWAIEQLEKAKEDLCR